MVVGEEFVEMLRGVEGKPGLGKAVHLGIVFFLRGAVGIAAAFVPTEVPVEGRTDVPELVQYGGEFFFKRGIEKPRQVEAEDVEILAPLGIAQLLHAITSAAESFLSGPCFETQRRERSVDAMAGVASSPTEADSHPFHVDVAKRVEPSGHVRGEGAYRGGEVESRALHRLRG